jgi:PPM family protein phosphatase
VSEANLVRPLTPLPPVEYAQRSDPGRDPEKQANEDTCMRRETRIGHLCVVCDGMGGHAAGREAAELAMATMATTFDRAPREANPSEMLRTSIRDANRAVHDMHTEEEAFGRPGCTVVAVLMHADGTEVAHVGDSRAYLVRGDRVTRITNDHSIVQELLDRGLITPQQAARHPDASRITRALGMGAEVEPEVQPSPIAHVVGDSFVLCSDGLTDRVDDEEILAIVGRHPPAEAVVRLVDLANARGGHDNTTVLVLRAQQTAGGSPAVPTRASGGTDTQEEGQEEAEDDAARSPTAERGLKAPDPPETVARERAKPASAFVIGLLWGVLVASALALAFVPRLRHLWGY